MAYEAILYEVRDGVGIITLNRPDALNAITAEMLDELRDVLRRAERDEAIRTLVLTGTGRAFCVGQDVRVLAEGKPEELVALLRDKYPPVLLQLHRIEKPVIAAVNGVAVGSGCNLALACDLRIASERASLGEVFVRIGAGPDTGCSYFMPRLVGLAKAAELIFTGKVVDAKEAERLGLVNQVVPQDKLMEETMGLAAQLARGPTRAIGLAKRALYQGLELDLEGVLDLEAKLQSQLVRTEDFQEGVRAFLDKRQPTFTGR
jgi:2-(1,2-epoxy-1,2-dihydrophenyl)acetyl-CoA isomerase